MTEQEYASLCEKYLSGYISPEDEALMLRYQEDHGIDDLPWITGEMGKQREVKRLLAKKLGQSIQSEKKTGSFSLLWRIASAAAILLFVSLTLYFLYPKQVADHYTGAKKPVILKNDVLPGSNKATLILANGSRVVLDSAKNGFIVKQGNAALSKNGKGVLTYTANVSDKNTVAENPMNTVSIPRGGRYKVVLPDGTEVWLNSASSLTFPTYFSGKERVVTLTGEAYFEVTKNKAMPFKVKFKNEEIEVLGTHFNINAYDDEDQTKTTLVEGSIKIANNNNHKILKPGELAVTVGKTGGINISVADVEEELAWKNGYFIFHDENIQSIMRTAARWYNVDVIYEGNFNDKSFGGRISQYKNISELLKNLELTGTIHFKIEGRRVTVLE